QSAGIAGVDERTDIYSLGAVGAAMLTGQAPPVAALNPSVAPELARVITRCLSREPDARWPNARALKEALGRLRNDAQRPPEPARDLPAFGAYAALWALMWI